MATKKTRAPRAPKGPKPRSGYCYEAPSLDSPNDDWEIAICSSGGKTSFVGVKVIDGVRCFVWKRTGGSPNHFPGGVYYIAQTAVGGAG